jgi:poly-gamma-glutamate synthesis protein (capsule biosynthesis protein)
MSAPGTSRLGDTTGAREVARSVRVLDRGREFSLVAVGDVLVHHSMMVEASRTAGGDGYDFSPMFARVRDLVSSADLALCNLETPVSSTNTDLTRPNVLSYNAPREIVTALTQAGFDACSTASNHTWDRGATGVRKTLDALDAGGLGHSGSARSAREAARPPIYRVNGVAVGHLSYSYTIHNSGGPTTTVPAEAPWLRSMLWPRLGADRILAQARALRRRGAEFVVVSMHWGTQYRSQPDPRQRRLARALLSSPDVDLILGHHPHVVQPCEKINGKYVVHSMGNFLSNQGPSQNSSLSEETQDGVLDRFTVSEVSPGRFQVTDFGYAPTRVDIPGHVVRPARGPAYRSSHARTARAVHGLGRGTCDATAVY